MTHRPVGSSSPTRAIVAALAVNLAGVLPLFLTGAMAVQMSRDLGFGPAQLGALSGAYAGSALVASAPLGGRVGTIGVRRSARIAAAVAAVSLLGGAVSPTVWWLALSMLVGGLANAIGQPAGNAMIAQHVPAARFGLGYAIKQSGIPLATLLAGLAVPSVALTIGWRAAFLIACALAAGAAVLPPPDRNVESRRVEGPVPRRLRGPLWALAAGLMLAVIAAPSIGAFGAIGGVAIGMSEASAGLLVAAGGLLGMTIRIVAGLWADRAGSGALKAVAALMLVGAVGWMLMASAFSTTAIALYVVGLLVANAFGWGWPGLLHLAVARMFPAATAAASGVTQTGVSAGLMVGPLVIGLTIERLGWPAAWSLAAACAAAASLAVFLIRRAILTRSQHDEGNRPVRPDR